MIQTPSPRSYDFDETVDPDYDPSDSDLGGYYNGPSAQETYERDWEQSVALHS
jgi:hypothetical protein